MLFRVSTQDSKNYFAFRSFQRNVFLKDRCTYSVLKLCQPTAEFTAATSIAL